MHKKIKSTLSLLLAILMIVTTIPFAFAADADCEHSGGKYGFENICEKCGEYFGEYDLKVGENSGFPITSYYDNTSTAVRFIPERNATCAFTSVSDDTSDPKVELYDSELKWLASADDIDGNSNFKLEYNFEAGKTYYLSFQDWKKDDGATAYTVTVEESCVHSGTQQTCKGYLCTLCGEYFGEKDNHVGTQQTCKGYLCTSCGVYFGEKGDHAGTKQNCLGYKCDTCGTYFGEKDLTKHQWNASGTGVCDLCQTKCTHQFDGDAENCSICNFLRYGVSVTSNGTTKKYTNLTEALENVKDGDTLKLLKYNPIDTNGSYEIVKSITFDFNGHSLIKSSATISVRANVTFTDSVSNNINCKATIKLYSKCTLGAGYYYRLCKYLDNSKWTDFLPECGGYTDDNSGNSKTLDDDTEEVSNTRVKQHNPKNNFEGVCETCGKFYGKELKLGDNEILENYVRAWNKNKYALKFVPEKTGTYLVKGSKTGKYYGLSAYDADLSYLNLDYSNSNDFTDSNNYDYYGYYNLDAGKTYYFSVENSYGANVDSTMNISLVCEHSGTTQTCKGYICDKCSRYFGEKGDHRLETEQTCLGYQCKDCYENFGEKGEHKLSTKQTCKGYKCEYCGYYFDEKDETKHAWSEWGYCSLCYEDCPKYDEHKTMDINCPTCGYSRFKVELISGTTSKKYVDFAAAIADAKDGDTIKLLKDSEPFTSNYSIEKAIVFDLNGHSFHTPGSDHVYVNANVTFIDSSADKTGYLGWGVCVYSPCKFESGKYISIYTELADVKYADFLAPCAKYYDDNGNEVDLDSTRIYDITVKQTHTLENDAAVAPTCTQTGKTAGKHCTNCDYKEGQTTVAALGHTFGSVVEAKAPTCTDNGNDAYKQCSVCKKYFSGDATVSSTDGKADNSSFIKTKLSHDFSGEMRNDGDAHSYKCVNGCGQYGNVTAHAWDKGTVTKEATHLELGVKTYKCACGAEKTEDIAKATEHTHILVSTTDATHLKEGVKVYRCACGDEYTETIDKLEKHEYASVVTAPTCTEKGYTTYTCACGDSYKDNYVDAKGHTFKDGKCDCGADDPNYQGGDQGGTQGGTSGDNTTNCDCICHSSSGFVQFIFKIVNWFWKILGWHKSCDCGKVHY